MAFFLLIWFTFSALAGDRHKLSVRQASLWVLGRVIGHLRRAAVALNCWPLVYWLGAPFHLSSRLWRFTRRPFFNFWQHSEEGRFRRHECDSIVCSFNAMYLVRLFSFLRDVNFWRRPGTIAWCTPVQFASLLFIRRVFRLRRARVSHREHVGCRGGSCR